jgi:hypothetical protein
MPRLLGVNVAVQKEIHNISSGYLKMTTGTDIVKACPFLRTLLYTIDATYWQKCSTK